MTTNGLVQGKDCIMQFDLGSGYTSIVCAKSFSFESVADLVETTTPGDGAYRTYDYDTYSFRITLSNLVKIVDPDSNVITFDLLYAQWQGVSLAFRLWYVEGANEKNIYGHVVIPSVLINASVSDLLDSTIEMTGTGAPSFDAPDTTCDITIDTYEVNIVGSNANVVLTPSSTPARYNYSLDGGAPISVFSDTFTVGPLSVGDHSIEIWAVCDNGYAGTSITNNFTVSGGA